MFSDKEIIVSCQIDRLHTHEQEIVCWMVVEAHLGGAGYVRVCGVDNVRAIKDLGINVKIIGCTKGEYENGEVYITPGISDVVDLFSAGADYVAVDFTMRDRCPEEMQKICCTGNIIADVSTQNEGITAAGAFNVCAVATTLSGYTKESQLDKYTRLYEPDLHLPGSIKLHLKNAHIDIPVIAEGRYWTPEQIGFAMISGADAVCIGAAITKPEKITKRLIDLL